MSGHSSTTNSTRVSLSVTSRRRRTAAARGTRTKSRTRSNGRTKESGRKTGSRRRSTRDSRRCTNDSAQSRKETRRRVAGCHRRPSPDSGYDRTWSTTLTGFLLPSKTETVSDYWWNGWKTSEGTCDRVRSVPWSRQSYQTLTCEDHKNFQHRPLTSLRDCPYERPRTVQTPFGS